MPNKKTSLDFWSPIRYNGDIKYLNNMTLTPEQFNKLVTKDEFNEFKSEMMEMKHDVKQILNNIEGLATSVKVIKDEQFSNLAAHDRFEERITKIEKHLNLKQAVKF